MNFYELFEFKDTKGEHTKKKDSEDHQDVTIADPKAALALKQARNKYSYADNDLEAFIKMTQDQDEEEQKEIDDLEAETAKQEELIQRNIEALQKNQENIAKTREQAQAAKERADQLERENKAQNTELVKLRAARKDYEEWAAGLINDINNMTQKLSGIETPQGKFQAAPLSGVRSVSEPSADPDDAIFRELPGLRK
jgi:chromosome segregation ATPase